MLRFGLNADDAKLTIFHLAMRSHSPKKTDAMSGHGNVEMIACRHQHCVAVAHNGHRRMIDQRAGSIQLKTDFKGDGLRA